MKDTSGSRRKLVVFTEHRDTLDYLVERIGTFLGRPEASVAIHGGLPRDQRRAAETAFKNDPEVVVLRGDPSLVTSRVRRGGASQVDVAECGRASFARVAGGRRFPAGEHGEPVIVRRGVDVALSFRVVSHD